MKIRTMTAGRREVAAILAGRAWAFATGFAMPFAMASSLAIVWLATGCSRPPSGASGRDTASATTPVTAPATASAAAAASRPPAAIDAARATAAGDEPRNWLLHGRTYDEQRYSPLARITADNVATLALAWHHDFETRRGMEATPIVVDGVIYVSGAWSRVYAFDGLTGKLLWQFDPKVPGKWAIHACCDVVNRGVAVWNGKVYVGTIDGRLIALDAATGAVKWETLTIDPKAPYTITGAPRIVKGKVFIGNGGAEFGVRGYVSAYDAESGAFAWRFYTVPGDPSKPFEQPILARAAATWKGEWWTLGGGGTVWDSMAYDPTLDLLYIGVGNGSPWNQAIRSPGGGDNWFLSSIVALRPDTGEYVWHYQTTPGESWDYTATQHMILADLPIGGATRKVIMQAPKNGFFYVLDRATGAFISAQPIVPVSWASQVDPATGRPVELPRARYHQRATPEDVEVTPGFLGAHNWHPMSFSHQTGLVYIPAQEIPVPYKALPKARFAVSGLSANLGIDVADAGLPDDEPRKAKILTGVKGHLAAWDPVRQKEVWRVQHQGPWSGGVLSTAGNLVFQGNAAGTFAAYAADTGKRLWTFDAQTGVMAAPISYSIGGEQYVAVMAGWGGTFSLLTGEISQKSGRVVNRSRLLVFKLKGSDALPPATAPPAAMPEPPPGGTDARQVTEGKAIFNRYCAPCHGSGAVAGGVLPDLRSSPTIRSVDVWNRIVLEGALEANGMVAFGKELSARDADAVRHYVIDRAIRAHRAEQRTAAGRSSP